MLANVISAVVGAVAAAYVSWRYRQNGKRSWYHMFAFGFAILASEVILVGQKWPVSIGIVSLATAMIGVVIDVENERSKKK